MKKKIIFKNLKMDRKNYAPQLILMCQGHKLLTKMIINVLTFYVTFIIKSLIFSLTYQSISINFKKNYSKKLTFLMPIFFQL